MTRVCLAALFVLLTSSVTWAQYVATSSYCKMLTRNHDTLANKSSLYVGGSLAMSHDGKHCGGCYHNKAGRITSSPPCMKAQDNGAASTSEAAVAACEDRAKRYGDADPKCKVVKAGADAASNNAPAQAKKQSDGAEPAAPALGQVDLRGLTLGATFDKANKVVKSQMKDAVVKASNQRVFHGGRFEYRVHINAIKTDKKLHEHLRAQFVPPRSISDGAEASEIGSVTFSSKRLDKRGIKLGALTTKLSAKYGMPTDGFVTGRPNAKWIYAPDGQLLTKKRIEGIQASMVSKCDTIDRANATQAYMDCKNAANTQRRCATSANEHCPYILSAKWRPMSGPDKGLLRSYELNLADVTANTRKNARIKVLREELAAAHQVDAAPDSDIKF